MCSRHARILTVAVNQATLTGDYYSASRHHTATLLRSPECGIDIDFYPRIFIEGRAYLKRTLCSAGKQIPWKRGTMGIVTMSSSLTQTKPRWWFILRPVDGFMRFPRANAHHPAADTRTNSRQISPVIPRRSCDSYLAQVKVRDLMRCKHPKWRRPVHSSFEGCPLRFMFYCVSFMTGKDQRCLAEHK